VATTRHPFVLHVADILRRPGSSRQDVVEGPLERLSVIDTHMPEGSTVVVDVRLESVNEGVVATGTVTAPWEGLCRRCLEPVRGTLQADVLEVFEAEPTEGETQLLDGDRIDLEPVAREAILLGLPMAPLCTEDCRGLCPTCGADLRQGDCDCTPPPADPRWAGLEGLSFDE
jgi:uncharacterized protein